MTIEEQGKIIETNSMMEALGYKEITVDDKEDGIYITYMLPKETEKKVTYTQMGEIQAPQ